MPTFPHYNHRRPWLEAGGRGGQSSSSDSESEDHETYLQGGQENVSEDTAGPPMEKGWECRKSKSKKRESWHCARKNKKSKTKKKRKIGDTEMKQKKAFGVWTSVVRKALSPNEKKVSEQAKKLTDALYDLGYYEGNKNEDPKNRKRSSNWNKKKNYLDAVKQVAVEKKLDLDFSKYDEEYGKNPYRKDWDTLSKPKDTETSKPKTRTSTRKKTTGGGRRAASTVTGVSSVASSSLPRASRRVQMGDLALR